MESRVSQPGSEDTTARPPSTSVGPEQRHSCSRRSFHSFSLKEIAVTQVGATLGHRELCHPRPQKDSQEPTVADGTSFSSPALGFGEQRDTWKDPPPPLLLVCCYRMWEVRWGGCQWPWVWNVVFGAGLPGFEPWQHHFALASMELFSCSLPPFSYL